MIVEQIYTGCLAQGAYFIESDGECAIIDPLREVDPYIRRAAKHGAKLRYVFETHFHADFVSGHLDLARRLGAEIVLGPTARPAYEATVAKDRQVFQLGKVSIGVIHTPGHTMESVCYLLRDEIGKDYALFTGDTLFIGEIGRPDLAQQAAHKTKEELAGILYDSLRTKILPLADDIIVYPGHGAGSACGKNMSTDRSDTLGHQKSTNYALAPTLTREELVRMVLEGLPPAPAYFPMNVKMNRQGYETMEIILRRGMHPMSPEAFELMAQETKAIIIDTRHADEFATGFIPGSVNIGLDGAFAPWAGTLISNVRQEILLVTQPGREQEAITRLARVGLDYCFGYLYGGIDSWKNSGKPLDQVRNVKPADAAVDMMSFQAGLLDVRAVKEFEISHVAGALNLPLDQINDNIGQVRPETPYFVYCAGGYRSMTFISIQRSRGFTNLATIQGGFAAIQASGRFDVVSIPELANK